jgi:hypothetical protein
MRINFAFCRFFSLDPSICPDKELLRNYSQEILALYGGNLQSRAEALP